MLIALLKLLSRLPLRFYRCAGSVVGWCGYFCLRREARRLRENLRTSGICSTEPEYRVLLRQCIRQTGQGVAEWFKAWHMPQAELERLCADCSGWDAVETAQTLRKPIIFLLPHLGSFPVAVRYTGQRLPLTVLHRAPKQSWRKPLVRAGGENAGVAMATTDFKGVEFLLRALKRGEAIAVAPDQAPNAEGGVWANFFGRPAYTMTLVRKLQRATGAALIGGFAERLPRGRGYRLRYFPVATENFDEAALNRAIENMVRCCPSQFIWSYNRYKVPRGAREIR